MSTDRDELHRMADELSDDLAGKVVQFARAEMAKDANDAGDEYLDELAADPERLARFRTAIDVGWQQSEWGEGRPVDEVFAEIRRRTKARR